MGVSAEWLKKLNQEFRDAGIEPRQRPFEAIRRYSEEHNATVPFGSELAKQIFSWFTEQSKPGTHNAGHLFESVYFFDTTFWTVGIPHIYGQAKLNALECLVDMPDSLKSDLFSTSRTAWDYTIFWADCADYGSGMDDLRKRSDLDHFGMQLLMAADQDLRSAIAQLKEKRPDSRSILSSRMATEIFIKSFIALKVGLTEKQAKELGHDLSKSFDRFLEVSGYDHLLPMKEQLKIYPSIHERYAEQSMSHESLWIGFALAHSIGALVVREHTARNLLQTVLPPQYGAKNTRRD